MQPYREPPLTNREKRIIRGMIDEYEYRRQRGAYWHELFSDVRVTILAIAAFLPATVDLIVHFWK